MRGLFNHKNKFCRKYINLSQFIQICDKQKHIDLTHSGLLIKAIYRANTVYHYVPSLVSNVLLLSYYAINQRLHLTKMKAATFTFAQSMSGHLLTNRFSPYQMVRFIWLKSDFLEEILNLFV
jgi:hypothetical protein